MKTKPEPGAIVKEKKNEQLGTTEITFANGAKAILKPTDFKNDEIVMTSFHKGGIAQYPAEDKFSANYAAAVVQQMGISDFSPVDLQKFMAGKIASANPRIGGLTAGISGNSSIKDFETMLQLVNLYFTAPRKDETLFTGWKEKQKSQMQFAMADPQNAFIDTFYQVLYQKNPLAPVVMPKPEDFDKINLDRSLAIYKEQFADANDFNFIFVGSFDIEKIKPLLATYLGSLPSAGKPAAFIDNGVRPAKGNIDLSVKKGTEPKSLIVAVYSGEVPYSESLALKAKALTEIMNIKIIEDLREKMGAIYGGGIFGGVNKYPYSNYSLFLQLPCGPQNVDTLLKAAAAEINDIKTNGPSQENLDKVKKGLEYLLQPLSIEDRSLFVADESLLNSNAASALSHPPQPFGVYNIKLMKCGGIKAAKEIATIAQHAGINLFWGCNDESLVSITAAIHAAYSCPNTKYIDLDGSFDLSKDLAEGGFILKDGYMYPNGKPGLGIKKL